MILKKAINLARTFGLAFVLLLFVSQLALAHGDELHDEDELSPAPAVPPVSAVTGTPALAPSDVQMPKASPVSIYLSAATHEIEMGTTHCWGCHRLPNLGTDVGRLAMSDLCLDCHKEKGKMDLENEGTGVGSKGFRLHVDRDEYLGDVHSRVACVQCHEGAQILPHVEETKMTCANCHGPFECPQSAESHPNISCATCHIEGKIELNKETGEHQIKPDEESAATAHKIVEWKNCTLCHFVGNELKTPSILIRTNIMPPPVEKIIGPLIRPFLSSSNITLMLAFMLFCLGAIIAILKWGYEHLRGLDIDIPEYLFSGLGRAIFTKSIKRFIGVIFFDLILMRRLLYVSPLRWVLNVMVWWPLLIFLCVRWTIIEGIMLGYESQAVFNFVSAPGWGIKGFYILLALMAMGGIVLGLALRLFGETLRNIGMPIPQEKGYTLIGEDIPAAILGLGLLGTITLRLLPVTNNGLLQLLHSLSWYGWIGLSLLFLVYSPFSCYLRGIFGPMAEFISSEADVSLGIKRGIGSSLKDTYPKQTD